MIMKKRVEYFKSIRDIPYRIPLAREEPDYCCNGKHRMLKKFLERIGMDVRLRICDMLWSDFDILPKDTMDVPHEDEGRHLYLEVKIYGRWKVLDATIDRGLESILPVNEWDGKRHTRLCVTPRKIYSPEESLYIANEEYDFEKDREINGQFYKELNEWFESIRKKNKK